VHVSRSGVVQRRRPSLFWHFLDAKRRKRQSETARLFYDSKDATTTAVYANTNAKANSEANSEAHNR
jgi:hypothetical protein